jgi:hypothetical protein
MDIIMSIYICFHEFMPSDEAKNDDKLKQFV